MTIEYEHRGLFGRTRKRIVEENGPVKHGVFYDDGTVQVEEEIMEYLTDMAEDLDYRSHSWLIYPIQAHLGGRLKTPHGTRDWAGRMPEDVKQFVTEIENAINQDSEPPLNSAANTEFSPYIRPHLNF